MQYDLSKATLKNIINWAQQNSDGGLDNVAYSNAVFGKPSVDVGWKIETSTPLKDGGRPFMREDMNGALNYLDGKINALMCGLMHEWDNDIVNYIKGYPRNALVVLEGNGYLSLRDNNMSEPNDDTTNWKKVF